VLLRSPLKILPLVFALAAASIVALGIPMITRPLPGAETDLRTWTWLLERGHLTPTVVSIFKIHNEWAALIPTFAGALAALILAVRSAPGLVVGWRSAAAGAIVASGWALFAAAGPNRLGIDRAAAKVLVADLQHAGRGAVGDAELARPCRRVGRLALHERLEVELASKIGVGHRGEQCLRIRMLRITEKLGRGRELHSQPITIPLH